MLRPSLRSVLKSILALLLPWIGAQKEEEEVAAAAEGSLLLSMEEADECCSDVIPIYNWELRLMMKWNGEIESS